MLAAAVPPSVGAVPVIQDDAAARQLYRRMIDALRAARTLSFDLEYRLNLGGLPGTRARCKVWLKKPNYFRLEASQVGGEGAGVLIGDGRQLWIYWPNGRPLFGDEDPATRLSSPKSTASRTDFYMTKPTPIAGHSIGHEVGYLGAGILMNILDLSTFHGYTDSLQPYVDAVAGRGAERIGEEECDVIEVSIMDGQRTWKIWLSRRDHLPRRLLETVRVHMDIVAEERWKNVVVNAEMPDTLFDWSPPENWKEWRKPEAEEHILRPGTLAPDFELRLSDGKTVKLSQFRGKVVWLFLWRVG